jgi:hypothetical protein
MESINFAWCARENALELMSKAGYQVSVMGSSTIRVFSAVLPTGQRKHRCTERIQTHAHGQIEEEDTSVIAMAETAVRRVAPNHVEYRGFAPFRIFRSSSKFVSNALPRLQGPVKRSGRIRQ